MNAHSIPAQSTADFLAACNVEVGGKLRVPGAKDFEWFGGRLLDHTPESIRVHLRSTGKSEIIPRSHILESKLHFPMHV